MCRRPECQRQATATLSFRYESAEVVVLDLVDERHPSRWDLCEGHADALRAPRGWEHRDQRRGPDPAPCVPKEPRERDELPEQAAGHARATNRYADLSARLPEIAAAFRGAAGSGQAPVSAPRGSGAQTVLDGMGFPVMDPPADIPGQLEMPLVDADTAPFSGEGTDAYVGNVVRLLPRTDAVLEPVR